MKSLEFQPIWNSKSSIRKKRCRFRRSWDRHRIRFHRFQIFSIDPVFEIGGSEFRLAFRNTKRSIRKKARRIGIRFRRVEIQNDDSKFFPAVRYFSQPFDIFPSRSKLFPAVRCFRRLLEISRGYLKLSPVTRNLRRRTVMALLRYRAKGA